MIHRDEDPHSGFVVTPDLYVSLRRLAVLTPSANGTRRPLRPSTYSSCRSTV